MNFNDNDKNIYAVLKAATAPLSFNQINEAVQLAGGKPIKIAQLTSAVKKGVAAKQGSLTTTEQKARKVTYYSFITAEPQLNPKTGKEFTLTDSEKGILDAISGAADGFDKNAFTLGDLSLLVGRKLFSGNILGLVRKGNIEKSEDMVERMVEVERTVLTYVVGDTDPNAAQ